ncbi:hypothetical protein SAMN05216463_11213 [Xylanibacter ruminicola]|uniref:VirE N-terminal domain-containing protein n=1 Tax=Xylanibacter ruminicola TaxID=839 RepID=A0A1M6VAN9_XYLRU|nr:hypothetical protein SAMN05216463_11213 [Xylanibacter ruminicola]
MSVHYIYVEDGVKKMRPIHSREEYLSLRNGGSQKSILAAVRRGDESKKHLLVQMNYSCLPNDDGTLKGSKRMTTTVAMDIDHVPPEEMQPLRERILEKKDELGLDMLEGSARGEGYHLVFARKPELSQEENLKWASDLLGVEYDKGAKDITRVFFTTTEAELIYLDDKIFEQAALPPFWDNQTTPNLSCVPSVASAPSGRAVSREEGSRATPESLAKFDLCAKEAGLDASSMDIWGERNWHSNLMAVLSVGVGKLMSREQLFAVVAERLKNYSQTDDCRTLINYFYDNYNADKGFMNAGLREINAKAQSMASGRAVSQEEGSALGPDSVKGSALVPACVEGSTGSELSAKRLPQGVRDSVAAVGPALAMPIITAICPCIGALATGVRLDVHGHMRGLNLISYIAGDFASGKGSIDPVVDAWMSEIAALDAMYLQQEEEYNKKKLAAKNKKEQPEDPKLPVRYITFNTTVAKLAERLGNTEGKHAFSFTPEADTVAQKWRSSMCDFSVMLRQSYDGSKYDREARSAEAVNVHIKHLLWNVTMCGTPDALYRVVTNYTDGFQSRIALAQTPDNTYAPLEDKPYVLTDKQAERIRQVAHLLPLMYGEVVLPKLEARGRDWLEKIRLEAMKNDDRVKARERFRTCVTAQRMVCCLMLCRVCEQLIQKHGQSGAETQLKLHPNLWKELLLKAQTPAMLDTYDVIADSLIDNALYFFRDRIENAFRSREYAARNERKRYGRNDTIYERLDLEFGFDMAMQHSISMNGADVSRNKVHQMLKNWKNQGLIVPIAPNRYRKVSH